MARMVPSPMDDSTESEAERLLYRKFEDELSDAFTVVHGARWVGRRRGRDGMDGEVDFLVLHPEHGILVIEAKSGDIVLEEGRWLLRSGRKERELSQSPVEQAHDSKYALLRILLESPRLKHRSLHLVHAVALPFSDVGRAGLGAEAPRERILDALDLQSLERWTVTALRSMDPPRSDLPDLGKDGVEHVVDAVAVSRAIKTHTPTVESTVRERLLQTTTEQFELLKALSGLRRAHVSGGPGSGKTLLAVETARRFAARGLRTLLVCFNGPLGGELKARSQGVEDLTTMHFHELCRVSANDAGLEDELARCDGEHGFEQFPDLLAQANDRLGPRFDAIVVDEAQDFESTWWLALEASLEGGDEGILHVFQDEEQTLYGDESPLPEGLQGPFRLTRNCRNSDEIHAFLAALPGGPTNLEAHGARSGILPRVTWLDVGASVPKAVGRALASLIDQYRVPAGDIVVLTPRGPHRSALGDMERLGSTPVRWRERQGAHEVLIDTVHRFKGLDATAVVLCEIAPDLRPDVATYLRIGCSRAVVHLDVLASRGAEAAFGEALARAEGT